MSAESRDIRVTCSDAALAARPNVAAYLDSVERTLNAAVARHRERIAFDLLVYGVAIVGPNGPVPVESVYSSEGAL